jgi:hypothetical protein
MDVRHSIKQAKRTSRDSLCMYGRAVVEFVDAQNRYSSRATPPPF